ncbi:MAG: hypothetical protein ACOX1X_09150 [Dethiobacteria bacterium]|jgi:hypothetical protein
MSFKKNNLVVIIIAFFMFALVQGCNFSKDQYESFELTDEEQAIYQQFAETKNDNLLKDLSPIQVVKQWLHADKIGDYRTQYYLFNIENNVLPFLDTDIEVTEEIWIQVTGGGNIDQGRFQKFFEEVVSFEVDDSYGNEQKIAIRFDRNDDSSFLFWLSKNSSGIWKVEFEPFDVPKNYRYR